MEMQWPATVMAKRAVCDAPKYGSMLALATKGAPISPRSVITELDPTSMSAIVPSTGIEEPTKTSPRQEVLDAANAYNHTLQQAVDEFYRIHEDLGLEEDLFYFGIGFWKEFLKRWDEVQDTIKKIPDAEEDRAHELDYKHELRKLTALKFELNSEELKNPAYSGLIFLLLLIFASVNFCVQNSLAALAPFVPKWMQFCFREALVKKRSIDVQEKMTTEINDMTSTIQDAKEELKDILSSLLRETGSTSEDSDEQSTNASTNIPNPVRTLKTLAEKVKDNSLSLPEGSSTGQVSSAESQKQTPASSTAKDTVKSNAIRKALAPAHFHSLQLQELAPGTRMKIGGRLIAIPVLPSHVAHPPRVSPRASPLSTNAPSLSPPQIVRASPPPQSASRPATARSPLR